MTETFDVEGILARQAAIHTRTMGLSRAFEKSQVPKDFLYPEESAKCTAAHQGVKTLLKESCRDIQRGVKDGSIPDMVLTYLVHSRVEIDAASAIISVSGQAFLALLALLIV